MESESDALADDRALAELERRRNERGARNRENARDAVLTAFLAAVAVSVAWGMWRLDDRSERLLTVVMAERASQASCP